MVSDALPLQNYQPIGHKGQWCVKILCSLFFFYLLCAELLIARCFLPAFIFVFPSTFGVWWSYVAVPYSNPRVSPVINLLSVKITKVWFTCPIPALKTRIQKTSSVSKMYPTNKSELCFFFSYLKSHTLLQITCICSQLIWLDLGAKKLVRRHKCPIVYKNILDTIPQYPCFIISPYHTTLISG